MDFNYIFPRYPRELLKGFIRRVVIETLERYDLILDIDVDPKVGITRLTALFNLLKTNYPDVFTFEVVSHDDDSKSLIIVAENENAMIQLKTWLIENKSLKWCTYFEQDEAYIMMLNSYEVTQ